MALAEGQTAIDFTFHMNIREPIEERLREIESIFDRGIPSFKWFMSPDGWRVPDDYLLRGMREVAERGGLSIVHAENDATIKESIRRAKAEGRTGLARLRLALLVEHRGSHGRARRRHGRGRRRARPDLPRHLARGRRGAASRQGAGRQGPRRARAGVGDAHRRRHARRSGRGDVVPARPAAARRRASGGALVGPRGRRARRRRHRPRAHAAHARGRRRSRSRATSGSTSPSRRRTSGRSTTTRATA